MAWTAVRLYDFLIDSKNLAVKLMESICNKLDLGQPVDGYLDMFYLISNIIFALEHTNATTYLDDDYDHLYELYTKVLAKQNRYKGL